MFKIAVITSTRAEYGLLYPLIKKIDADPDLELLLYVTGGHLSEKQGLTVHAIEEDGIPIKKRVPILDPDNGPQGISKTMANALIGFADCFAADRPDLAVILGDRTEMLGVAAAALNERIPLAHIHGGEVTEGAVDDCIRHSLTKMSYLHFVSTEIYRNRIIQMGEAPERVFNVGALGTDNILSQQLLSIDELRMSISGLPNLEEMPFAVVTYHPVTLGDKSVEEEIDVLCKSMDDRPDIFFIITGANADTGGDRVNEMLKTYCDTHANGLFVQSLGMKRYLSIVKHASFVLGNSSSGIIEAPVLGTPTVNIGDRQKGRLMAETIVCCSPDVVAIKKAMEVAIMMEHKRTYLYGNGTSSEMIVKHIKDFTANGKIKLKKGFYDLKAGIYE